METVASLLPESPAPPESPAGASAFAGGGGIQPVWWRRLLQSGTGIAFAIEGEHLDVMVVRVRPSRVKLVGWKRFPSVADRPASAVGTEILQFLRGLGAAHMAAHVLLPREETIVRMVQLPGNIAERDLLPAVELQLETLHPYADHPISFGVVRVGKSGSVLVGICREELVDRWISFFAEAGIKLAAIRITADVFHQAVRVLRTPPRGFLVSVGVAGEGAEFYGESTARPVYSVLLYNPSAQAAERARADLRIEASEAHEGDDITGLDSLLAGPETAEEGEVAQRYLPLYATALSAATAFPGPTVNLLPADLRKGSNWAMVLPTLLITGVLALMVAGSVVQQSWQQRDYAQRLQAEIALLERQVAAGRKMDEEGERVLARLELLRDFRLRTRRDLSALLELTKVVPESAWVTQLELTPTGVNLSGEASQAGDLLRLLDASPQFAGSSFSMPLQRAGESEVFRVRANREKQP